MQWFFSLKVLISDLSLLYSNCDFQMYEWRKDDWIAGTLNIYRNNIDDERKRGEKSNR